MAAAHKPYKKPVGGDRCLPLGEGTGWNPAPSLPIQQHQAPDGPFPSCLVQVGKPFRCWGREERGCFMVLWILALFFLHRFDFCCVRLL